MRSWTKSRLSKLATATAILISLSACASRAERIVVPDADALYPVELLSCTDEPALTPRPDPTVPRSDAEQTAYVSGLRAAFNDCKDTVEIGWRARRNLYAAQERRENSGGGFLEVFQSVLPSAMPNIALRLDHFVSSQLGPEPDQPTPTQTQ